MDSHKNLIASNNFSRCSRNTCLENRILTVYLYLRHLVLHSENLALFFIKELYCNEVTYSKGDLEDILTPPPNIGRKYGPNISCYMIKKRSKDKLKRVVKMFLEIFLTY